MPEASACSTVVLIPAYVPADGLPDLAAALDDAGFAVVVVDDGSGSASEPVFARLPGSAVLLRHEVNRGKGVALKTGLTYIAERLPEVTTIVTADADGQHLLSDIAKVAAYERTEPTIVLGSRRVSEDMPLSRRFGNTVTRNAFRDATGVEIEDTQTGLRAFGPALIPDMLAIEGEHYEYEMSVLIWAVGQGVAIVEVPISTVYVGDTASHFDPVVDSARVYSRVLRTTLARVRSFVTRLGSGRARPS